MDGLDCAHTGLADHSVMMKSETITTAIVYIRAAVRNLIGHTFCLLLRHRSHLPSPRRDTKRLKITIKATLTVPWMDLMGVNLVFDEVSRRTSASVGQWKTQGSLHSR